MVSLFQTVVWHRTKWIAGLLVLIAGLLYIFASQNELFQRLEDTLLDARLRIRAQTFAPSDEIVIVGFDQGSKEYFEKHPELGILGSTLPRNRLAKVIQTLHQKKAASIVLDVELKSPSENPTDDEALAKAIKAAGNVSVASYSDYSLRDFIHQDAEGFDMSLYQNATFISAYIQPYLNHSVTQCRYASAACVLNYLSMAFQPEFQFNDETIRLPENFSDTWHAISAIDYFASKGFGSGLKQPQPLLDSKVSPREEAYARLCLVDRYRQLYVNRPAFLERLAVQSKQLLFSTPARFEDEQNFSYCRMSPVIEPVSAVMPQVGISTVHYEDKTFLRQIPIFYKGYQGRYFYYLPLLPIFEKWHYPSMKILSSGIDIEGQKQIDFFNGHGVLINWRNPKLLAEKIYTELDIPIGNLKAAEYANVGSTNANQVLGFGHLYRVVSLADLIKRQENPLNQNTPTLYNLYGKPFSGEFDFKNKIVIYGDMVKDIHITPVGDMIYGPEILANVADMVLHDQNFVHPAPVIQVLSLVMVVIALMIYPVIVWRNLGMGILIALTGLATYWVYNFFMFTQHGLYFPLVWPTLLALLALFSTMFYRYSIQDKEKRQLTHVFSKYVSPQVMKEILSNTEMALDNLKGRKKEMTVLFVDIHNFTEQFENAAPELMVAQLNVYFNAMIHVVLSHGGTYDKYMGDSLMAFFGAPTDDPDHTIHACQAAIAMQKALDDLNTQWEKMGLPVLRHGVGISSGLMFVGNLGSDDIKNFTVMGSVVNLGSRLETLTRQLHQDILVSQRTKELANQNTEFEFTDMGKIMIKGFSQEIQVFALQVF